MNYGKMVFMSPAMVMTVVLLIMIIRTLRNYDCDGNENVKKTIGLINKTTTLHVHHAFLYISLSFLHKYDVKWPILRSLENGNGKL